MILYKQTTEFQKEFKWLSRKYRTLEEDIGSFKNVIDVKIGDGTIVLVSKHWAILTSTPTVCIVKARLACKYLHRESLRIIFAYHPKEKSITFIELYFKGDKETEDKQRYETYLQSLHA